MEATLEEPEIEEATELLSPEEVSAEDWEWARENLSRD
jgi:hypothetical protein